MGLLQVSTRFIKNNASTILTCLGGVGVIATAVLTAKAAPKASKMLEDAKEEKGEKLTVVETVKIAGPSYIPAVLTGAATITCIFGANVLNKRKQAALMSAYALLDQSYKEYKAKVQELYGEEADVKVRTEIAKDNYDEDDYEEEDNTLLFYDEYSQTYFNATMEDVLKAEMQLNRDFQYHGIAVLNEFYDLLKLPRTEFGECLGWSTCWLCETQWYAFIEFYHRKVELEDGMECYILEILTEPVPENYFDDY